MYFSRVFQTEFGNLFPAHSSTWMLGLGSESHSSITSWQLSLCTPIFHLPHLISHIWGAGNVSPCSPSLPGTYSLHVSVSPELGLQAQLIIPSDNLI